MYPLKHILPFTPTGYINLHIHVNMHLLYCLQNLLHSDAKQRSHTSIPDVLQNMYNKLSLTCRYTDGCGKNGNNQIKVQLSPIAVFFILNLNMPIAAGCTTRQSWQNHAERVLALLNIVCLVQEHWLHI